MLMVIVPSKNLQKKEQIWKLSKIAYNVCREGHLHKLKAFRYIIVDTTAAPALYIVSQ